MNKYLGSQIVINNFLFILTIPIAMFAGFLFGSTGFYGGMIEALFAELVLIILFFIFLMVRITKINNKEIKIIYSYLSCITAYFVATFVLWQSFKWLDMFFRILDIVLLIIVPYGLVFLTEKVKFFLKRR